MLVHRVESAFSGEPPAQRAALALLVEDWGRHDAGALARRQLPAARALLLDVLQALVEYNQDSNLSLNDVARVIQGAKALRVQDYLCQEADWVDQVARRFWVTSWSIGSAEGPVRRLFYTLVVGPETTLGTEDLTYLTETLHEQCGQHADLEVTFGLGVDAQLGSHVRVVLVAGLA